MKTGILFDLDGTLLDTLGDLCDSVNETLLHFGYPTRTLGEVRRFVGNGAMQLIRLSIPEGEDPEAPFAYFHEYYNAHCRIKTKPYGGILSALDGLKKKYPVAIVSNKPDSAVKQLCADFFPGIWALGEASDCPRKPAPDMVYKAMSHLGVERCIYVGDSEVDILTARNADVPCLSVLWGFRDQATLEAAGGQHFCKSPDQLSCLLEEMIHVQ